MNKNIFKKFPEFSTDRLFLRQTTIEDTEDYHKIRTDPTGMQFMDIEQPKSVEESRIRIIEEIKSFNNQNSVYWVIAKKDTGEFVGGAGYWRLIKEHYRAEIGYQIVTDHWKKGYAFEALKAIIQFGFEQMGVHSIEANINPANVPSIKLIEKLGFVQEAYFKENFYFNGKFLDSNIYSLLVTKWKS